MKRLLVVFSFLLAIVSSKATQYGPYWMYETNEQPAGYAKIVCFSQPQYIAVGVVLINVNSQEQILLSTSGTYLPMWYYYIPAGTYEVYSIDATNASVRINGFDVDEGDQVVFTSGGSLIAYPSN